MACDHGQEYDDDDDAEIKKSCVFRIWAHCSQISVRTSRLIELDRGTTHCDGWNRENQRASQLFSSLCLPVQEQTCFNYNYSRTNER